MSPTQSDLFCISYVCGPRGVCAHVYVTVCIMHCVCWEAVLLMDGGEGDREVHVLLS